MNRRDALKNTFLIIGGTTISASTIVSVMSGCKPAATELGWKPVFLNEGEARTLTAAVDALIPRTETPGAVDAGVPQLIDLLAQDIFGAEDRKRLQDGLAQMNKDSQEKFNDDFSDLSVEQQTELLTAYDQQAFGQPRAQGEERPFFADFKQLVVFGYCTSEQGATQHLQYEAVPGGFQGCIPIGEAGRGVNWAT